MCSAWLFPHGESIPHQAIPPGQSKLEGTRLPWRHQEQPDTSMHVISPSRFPQIHGIRWAGKSGATFTLSFLPGSTWHLIPSVMPLKSTQTAPYVEVRKAVTEGHPASRKDVMDVASTL